jgi:Grx4 family monothiol glutaredoxin
MALSLPSDALPPGKASILFWASWHEPSVQMKEVVEALAEDVAFKIHIADPEERPNAAAAAEIKSVPAIIFLHNGRVWGRIDGADPAKYVSKSEEFDAADVEDALEPLNDRLKRLINAAPVMMFMKGDKKAPFCKFSKQSVELLNELNIEYGSFDILTDEEVRQGLKEYSNWPTYPQLYVEGELIGGVDIMKEMKEDGSLLELISEEHRVKPRESQDEKYRKLVTRAPIMLFMKGSPDEPVCGFSNQIVSILNRNRIEYGSFNILEDEDVRQGLKEWANWPTYPQVWSNGELIGGLDIVKEMESEGSLRSELGLD